MSSFGTLCNAMARSSSTLPPPRHLLQVMHAYMRPNVSATSQMRISVVSKALAIALELFAFVYIGMSVTQPQFYEIFIFVVSGPGRGDLSCKSYHQSN
jgi:hypothetical protein